jgi:hypothetical protein
MPPKFTKKHYIELARMLGRTMLDAHTTGVLIRAFSSVFTEDNPQFDEVRFTKMVEKERTHA